MAKGRRNKRAGRKSDPDALRKQTTAAGRRSRCWCRTQAEYLACRYRHGCPGPDLVVTIHKEARKRMTTREDLPTTPLGVMCGRGLLSADQYEAGLYYEAVLTIWRRGIGPGDLSAEGIYRRMVAGDVSGGGSRWTSDAVDRPMLADRAQWEAARLEASLPARQIGIARGIVAGDWSDAVSALVQHGVLYVVKDGTLVPEPRPEGWRMHERWLLEARAAFAAIDRLGPLLKAVAA